MIVETVIKSFLCYIKKKKISTKNVCLEVLQLAIRYLEHIVLTVPNIFLEMKKLEIIC